jgi:glucuronate isomerase
MSANRFLGPHTAIARELLSAVETLPLVCPHGHVDPAILADPHYRFPDPVAVFLRPDHYILRMLTSAGLAMDWLLDEGLDPREVWRAFAQCYRLFAGTPSALWLDYQLRETFGLSIVLSSATADLVYEELRERLERPEFRPRALYERLGIEVLCTTDAATDTLQRHRAIADDAWEGRVLPTFRPDKLLWGQGPGWLAELGKLEEVENVSLTSYPAFLDALRARRKAFVALGCTASDHGTETPHTELMSPQEAATMFQRALQGELGFDQAVRWQGHLLMEMAAMSCEDGLVMQLHCGSLRNHNQELFGRLGPDRGADIPVAVEFTRSLRPLLNRFGSLASFRLIVFTLDESTYSRELAPLAGHYPAMLLGPPWWFHDSSNGMRRYFDQVMETAGVFNTAGFNDDTRAFCSIPARHDLWRRASCRWLSGLVADQAITLDQAHELAYELAVGRAREAYRLSPQDQTAGSRR